MAARRILMVSYWYPPTPGAGAERVAGFSRHLPEHGWEPIVLAAESHGASLSARLFGFGENESGETSHPVFRVPDLVGASAILSPYSGPPAPNKKATWLRRFVFPDRFAIWAGRVEREATYKLLGKLPDLVWTTFPPASAAMAAGRIADRFSRPLVLDLRDPWLGPGGYSPLIRRQRERHEALEARLVRQAAAISVISEAMRDDLCRRLDVDPQLVHVISNGFDGSRCVAVAQSPRYEIPQLVHTGSVSQRNRPDLFLNALAAERRRGTLSLNVRFVGNLSSEYLASVGLADCVASTGMVSWESAWVETCQATALLLLVGNYVGKWGHNTKVFEYLRSGRPILCLEESPGSNDRRILEEIAKERTVFGALDDPASIVASAVAAISLGRDTPHGAPDDSAALNCYDRGRLTGHLAEILDTVMASR